MLESIHRFWFTASVRLYTTHTNKYSNSHFCTKSCTVKFRCKSSYLLFIFNTYVSDPQVSPVIFYLFYFTILFSCLALSVCISRFSLSFSRSPFSSLFIIDSFAFWTVYNALLANGFILRTILDTFGNGDNKYRWLGNILADHSSIQ